MLWTLRITHLITLLILKKSLHLGVYALLSLWTSLPRCPVMLESVLILKRKETDTKAGTSKVGWKCIFFQILLHWLKVLVAAQQFKWVIQQQSSDSKCPIIKPTTIYKDYFFNSFIRDPKHKLQLCRQASYRYLCMCYWIWFDRQDHFSTWNVRSSTTTTSSMGSESWNRGKKTWLKCVK